MGKYLWDLPVCLVDSTGTPPSSNSNWGEAQCDGGVSEQAEGKENISGHRNLDFSSNTLGL